MVSTFVSLLNSTSAFSSILLPTRDSVVHPVDVYYINVSSIPQGASAPIPEAFISYSVEFAFFPDYAGNKSHPNIFSENLLNNIGEYAGTKPYIRVGGNTQDYAMMYPPQTEAVHGVINPAISADYPTMVSIGTSFFESYSTFSNTKYIHGFNLAKNDTGYRLNLLSQVLPICKALHSDKLLYWELGNEPDLFKTSAQGIVRPQTWNESDYVMEWLDVTRQIKERLKKDCPEMATSEKFKWVAPSFAGPSNSLSWKRTWSEGLDSDKNIALVSSHNYISGATSLGVTLQGTLMNHTRTISSLSQQIALSRRFTPYSLPFILGETNSLYNQGRLGLSNTFGAALWGVDFALYAAANNISRLHFHQGTNFRYSSWQPISTGRDPANTRPPYYGNLASAAMIGNSTGEKIQLVHLPLKYETEAAYAAYENLLLKRIMVINMREYNYTSTVLTNRPSETYWFNAPVSCSPTGTLHRLMANGSNAISGVNWDGMTYPYELRRGKPVKELDSAGSELVHVGQDGVFQVQVPWSSAVMVALKC